MKKRFLYITTVLISLSIGLNSCFFKDDIGEEFTKGQAMGETEITHGNVDKLDFKKKLTQAGVNTALAKLEETKSLGLLLQTQYNMRGGKGNELPGPHAYQFQFSLVTDNYAGYMCLPQNFAGRMPSTYYDSRDFNGGPMGSFLQVKNTIVPLLNHPQVDSIPEIKAIGLLMYDYSAQEVTDIYGPMPYEDYKVNKQNHPYTYNKVEDIYKKIVSNIDTIVACLDYYKNRPDWYKSKIQEILDMYDRVSDEKKDLEHWKKFANSLKLRMALHVVKADPDNAKKWAEEAVASGVIEETKEQFMLSPAVIGFSHPLATIANLWNDTRLNASLESIMKSYNHPFLEFTFDKNSNNIINKKDPKKVLASNTKVIGLRTGIRMLEGQNYDVNFRTAYSTINQTAISQSPLFLMKLSEVYFLRAEGALRGWNMKGAAESLYNKGIELAFKSANMVIFDENWNEVRFEDIYAKFLPTYMAMEKAIDYTYEDPYNERYTTPSLTKVGVKWNNSDNDEVKLEKIITQKYIAGFPYSFEAWVDIRRTGYPKIFPVLHDDGDGTITPGDIIRRIPFPGKENSPAIQADISATALEALNGPDKQGTRLWWDVQKANF